jgi:hypothetical protein
MNRLRIQFSRSTKVVHPWLEEIRLPLEDAITFVSFVLIVVGPCLVAHFARNGRER